MKKIYYILITILVVTFTLTACSEKDPFSTATSQDEPRILAPLFPDRVNGKLPIISNYSRDANLNIALVVTPADYATVAWFIDGEEVATDKEIDMNLYAGTYNLKVVVSTEFGKSTTREGIVQVNPLVSDPWSASVGFERTVAPGAKAQLYGTNLGLVKGIIIDGKVSPNVVYSESEKGGCLEYDVPSDLVNGDYRVVLIDADGNEYGANMVTVTADAMILANADRANANREWTMSGINLDKIKTLTFADIVITDFTIQTSSQIAFICPALKDGQYKLTGKMSNGSDVVFSTANGIANEKMVVVSSQTALWEGHHYVSWNLPDGNPNKTFSLIGKDVFASLTAGTVMKIHFSIEPNDEYHQMRTTSGQWNDLPGTGAQDYNEDGIRVITLTQPILDMIQAQDGFLCVGHGYYVDMITVE